MAVDTLVHHVAAHLAAQGLGRLPDVAGAGARPWPAPLWRNPPDGTPAPGDRPGTENDDGVVVGLFRTGGISQPPGLGYLREVTIDLQYRGRTNAALEALARGIRLELAPEPIGSRYDWIMDGIHVYESRVYSELQPLGASLGEGWTYRETYVFQVHAASA